MTSGGWRAERVSAALMWPIEALAFIALASTSEVNYWVFAGAVALLGLSAALRSRGSGRLQPVLMAIALGVSIAAVLGFRIPLVVAAAQAAPLFHAALWFSPQTFRQRGWRIAMAFVELNLAAYMTNEVYLAPIIFLFAILASVSISSGFLAERGAVQPGSEVLLPRGYLRGSFLVSFWVLLTGLVIFPILPRMKGGVDMGSLAGPSHIGYVEEVRLARGGTALTGEGEGRPLLHVRLLEETGQGDDPENAMYLGLIRGKTLARFDGVRWQAKAAVSPSRPNTPVAQLKGVPRRKFKLEFMREAMDTSVLPVPYGARALTVVDPESGVYPIRQPSGEWTVDRLVASTRRLRYQVELEEDEALTLGSSSGDAPTEIESAVPHGSDTPPLRKIRDRLFKPAMSATAKVARLRQFFLDEGFKGSVGGEGGGPDRSIRRSFTPIESFLLITKTGHCELFSSASALLLRMAGVPTRLVSGLRLSHSSVAGVLTVRDGDAHAWLEYWIEGKGWKAFDPSPRILMAPGPFDYLQGSYEAVSALWYRYLSSDNYADLISGSRSGRGVGEALGQSAKEARDWIVSVAREHARSLLGFGLAALLLGACAYFIIARWYPWVFSIRGRVREGPAWLKRRRIRLEQLLARKLGPGADGREARARFGPRAAEALAAWSREYDRARFGRSVESEKAQGEALDRATREFRRAISKPRSAS